MVIFLWLVLVVVFIVVLTVKFNLHPFLALLFGAILMGFIAKMEVAILVGSLADGFGSTLRSIGIVIAAGAIIGDAGSSALDLSAINTIGIRMGTIAIQKAGGFTLEEVDVSLISN